MSKSSNAIAIIGIIISLTIVMQFENDIKGWPVIFLVGGAVLGPIFLAAIIEDYKDNQPDFEEIDSDD